MAPLLPALDEPRSAGNVSSVPAQNTKELRVWTREGRRGISWSKSVPKQTETRNLYPHRTKGRAAHHIHERLALKGYLLLRAVRLLFMVLTVASIFQVVKHDAKP